MIMNQDVRINEKLTDRKGNSIFWMRSTGADMARRLITKKRPSDIRKEHLSEPALNGDSRLLVEEGVRLFNTGKYWAAHEVWEEVWRGCADDSRIFFQGIIQAAAGYHLLFELPRLKGAKGNLAKALEKLDLFPTDFLGINVEAMRGNIRTTLATLESVGPKNQLAQLCPPAIRKSRRRSFPDQ
jgi:predicted metal-dependent hydrolase